MRQVFDFKELSVSFWSKNEIKRAPLGRGGGSASRRQIQRAALGHIMGNMEEFAFNNDLIRHNNHVSRSNGHF